MNIKAADQKFKRQIWLMYTLIIVSVLRWIFGWISSVIPSIRNEILMVQLSLHYVDELLTIIGLFYCQPWKIISRMKKGNKKPSS